MGIISVQVPTQIPQNTTPPTGGFLFAGDWDMSSSTPAQFALIGAVMISQQLTAIASFDYPVIASLGSYISAKTSMPTVVKIGMPILATDLTMIGLHHPVLSVADQAAQIMTGAMPSGLLLSISNNDGLQVGLFGELIDVAPSSVIIDNVITLRITDNVLTIDGYDGFSYDVPPDDVLSVASFDQLFATPAPVFIDALTDAPATLPTGWFNHAVYRVTGAGRYVDKFAGVGDFVAIIEQAADVIVMPAGLSELIGAEQLARIAADDAEQLARIAADDAERLDRIAADEQLQQSLTDDLQILSDDVAAGRVYCQIKIVNLALPNGDAVAGSDVYYLNDRDLYMIGIKQGYVGSIDTFKHLYRWTGNAADFEQVPDADADAMIAQYAPIFNYRNELFFGSLSRNGDGVLLYDITHAHRAAGDTQTGLVNLYNDPSKHVTGGYMSLDHVSRLYDVEQLAQQKPDADDFADVATSGSYTDLTNKPAIPTNNNQLTNGAGFIASAIDKVLTGLSVATATAVTATDSILTAIGKLQGQIVNNAALLPQKIGSTWYKSGKWYNASFPFTSSMTTLSPNTGVQYFMRFTALENKVFNYIAIACITAGLSGDTIQLGVYASDANNNPAGLPLFVSSNVPVDTTGNKSVSCTLNLIAGKTYWLSFCLFGNKQAGFRAINNLPVAFDGYADASDVAPIQTKYRASVTDMATVNPSVVALTDATSTVINVVLGAA